MSDPQFKYDTIDYGVTVDLQKNALNWTCRKLSSFIENYIMEGVRSPSPETQDCYLKNIFPSMLSNISLDLISVMGVTDHRHYDW